MSYISLHPDHTPFQGEHYHSDAKGNVTILCGYCQHPCRVFESSKVRVGRFIKRPIKAVLDDPDPELPDWEVIVGYKLIPAIKSVDGCPTCAAMYQVACATSKPGQQGFLKL